MKKYLLGILGGLLGGLIGAIPWVLVYVYANFMFSMLAIIVALGVNFGYRKFGGPVDKKAPFIIAGLSLLSVTIATLVVIPALLGYNELGYMNMEVFKALYTIPEFVSALMGDYVISIAFTVLGIWGTISNLKKEVGTSKAKDKNFESEDILRIEEYFLNKGATNMEKAITIKTVDRFLKEDGLKNAFNYLKTVGRIKKKDDKCYLIEATKKSNQYLIFGIVLIIIVFLVGFIFNQ